MGLSVVYERDLVSRYGVAVYCNGTNIASLAYGVVHDDVVDGRSVAISDLVMWPIRRDAGVYPNTVASLVKAEDRFEADTIKPTGRAGIPSPATASRMRRRSVNVRRDGIRFHHVP